MAVLKAENVDERARQLMSQMTLEEKCSQLTFASPAIPRLGIEAYNWWNECLHGVGRAGLATVFPQAIGLAATFDAELMQRVATTISDEARAKHHAHASRGDFTIYKGLTFWAPNINIFRDPRWGRGHETYGECPYLTSELGVAFVRGLQGNDPQYLKVIATPKHFAVHSGPEQGRHGFDAQVTLFDLYDTYLPAFRATVIEGKAQSVMGAYNRLNGVPCCASDFLLNQCLRQEWGFDGYTVSDCGAITDLHEHHKVTRTPAESAAMAVNNGLDLCCGQDFEHLREAAKKGLVNEAAIDRSLFRLLGARLKLGMFDPPDDVPYAKISYSVIDSAPHRELALQAARESIVLLKNQNHLLPLSKTLKSIAVIGPNAEAASVQLGNYHGTPSFTVTALQGIRAKLSPEARVLYAMGTTHLPTHGPFIGSATRGFVEAVVAAQEAEVTVLCLGLNSLIEGEEGDAMNSDAAGDRTVIELPDIQQQLLDAIVKVGKPVVLLLMGGSAMATPFAQENVAAIVQQFYPGQSGGTALADVLFGDFNPCGRLPVTVYRGTGDLPPFQDYSMTERTYRYFSGVPLYPFGYGLSYTTFSYDELQLSKSEVGQGEELMVWATVRNTGTAAGCETVQLYLSHDALRVDPPRRVPIRSLAGVRRLFLQPCESARVAFSLSARQLQLVNENGQHVHVAGPLTISVGGSQPDARSIELLGTSPTAAQIDLI
jgi:beta-glucosidase